MKNKRRNRLFSTILIFLAFLITMLSVLTGAFLQGGYDIHVGSVSKMRFKAPKEVVDEIATQKIRDEAMASVVPLYKHDPEIKDRIMQRIIVFFDEMSVLRAETSDIYNPYENIENIQDNTEDTGQAVNAEPEYNFENISIYLANTQYRHLVELPSAEYEEFKDKVISVAGSALDAGIKEESMAKNLVAVRSEFEEIGWDAIKENIGYEIVATVLGPNLMVDEEATQRLREEKAEEIEPVFYSSGQKIIDEDEVITAEIYAVLDSLGYTDRSLADNYIPVTGAAVAIIILFVLIIMYIYYFNRDTVAGKKEMLLLFTLYALCIAVSRAMSSLPFQIMPIILFTMLISLLLESRLAIIMNILVTVACGIAANADMHFMLYFLITGVFAALMAKYATDRSKTFPSAILICFFNGVTTVALGFFFDKNISNETVNAAIFAVLSGLLTVILCMGTLPVWEFVFGVVTPIKMMDLINPNNKLLRRLTIEAPGTYQHSLIVGNLAETAAFDIGADATLARAGAYYHDIGKLDYPQYYSENQMGENPHDAIDPYTSVKIIIGHVTKGISMAEESKLPRKVADIVEQHHGNTLMKYFYYEAKKLNPDGRIDEDDFRYNFSLPSFKESAIIMLADTIEAAVRSVSPSSKTNEELEIFVRTLIKDKFDDGQLINSMLTIKDLDTIAKSFMRVFKSMYHHRVAYPKATMAELNSDEEASGDTEEFRDETEDPLNKFD